MECVRFIRWPITGHASGMLANNMVEAYRLAPRLDMSASQQLVSHLLSKPSGAATVLDASDVTHMGALCAQALMAAGLRNHRAGGSLEIINADERIEVQLGSMGLTLNGMMEGQA